MMKMSVTAQLMGAASTLVLTGTAAMAQISPPPAQVAAPEAESDVGADIVVTGTSTRQRKFDAPYSVSTIDKAQIADAAPHSVADLLAATPGITVEASGGEGGGRERRHPRSAVERVAPDRFQSGRHAAVREQHRAVHEH